MKIFGFCCREYHDIPCHYVPIFEAILEYISVWTLGLPLILIVLGLSKFERNNNY